METAEHLAARRAVWKEQTSRMIHRHRKVSGKQRDDLRMRYGDGEDPMNLAVEFGLTAAYIRAMGPMERP